MKMERWIVQWVKSSKDQLLWNFNIRIFFRLILICKWLQLLPTLQWQFHNCSDCLAMIWGTFSFPDSLTSWLRTDGAGFHTDQPLPWAWTSWTYTKIENYAALSLIHVITHRRPIFMSRRTWDTAFSKAGSLSNIWSYFPTFLSNWNDTTKLVKEILSIMFISDFHCLKFFQITSQFCRLFLKLGS